MSLMHVDANRIYKSKRMVREFSPLMSFCLSGLLLESFVRRDRGSIVVTSGTWDATLHDSYDTAPGKSSEKLRRIESDCK